MQLHTLALIMWRLCGWRSILNSNKRCQFLFIYSNLIFIFHLNSLNLKSNLCVVMRTCFKHLGFHTLSLRPHLYTDIAVINYFFDNLHKLKKKFAPVLCSSCLPLYFFIFLILYVYIYRYMCVCLYVYSTLFI